MKAATPEESARRLAKLLRRCETLAAFVAAASKFPRFYGFPGRGSRADWENYFRRAQQKP